MKNAIVYGVNNNKVYMECMVNSINSLYANNSKELLDGIDLFILTTNQNIDLHELDFRAKPIIVQLDYSMFFTERAKNNKCVKRYS